LFVRIISYNGKKVWTQSDTRTSPLNKKIASQKKRRHSRARAYYYTFLFDVEKSKIFPHLFFFSVEMMENFFIRSLPHFPLWISG
jgi:hypothetical protein